MRSISPTTPNSALPAWSTPARATSWSGRAPTSTPAISISIASAPARWLEAIPLAASTCPARIPRPAALITCCSSPRQSPWQKSWVLLRLQTKSSEQRSSFSHKSRPLGGFCCPIDDLDLTRAAIGFSGLNIRGHSNNPDFRNSFWPVVTFPPSSAIRSACLEVLKIQRQRFRPFGPQDHGRRYTAYEEPCSREVSKSGGKR